MTLKRKLMNSFLAMALTPILLVGLITSYVVNNSIEKQVFSKLVAVRDIKTSQIEDYFDVRKNDLEVLSDTVKKILDFSSLQGLASSAHQNHQYFARFIKTYGYYDLFIINDAGDIFYSVTKEADYQTNLLSGEYSDSGLGKLFRKTQSNSDFAMSDFSPYAPSNNEPANFIAIPFKNKNVSVVIAMQLSIDNINALMQQRSGMGETGESYLVGTDLRMRSDSYLDPKGHSVNASFAGTVEKNGVETDAARLAINGEKGQKIIIDYNGNPVLSAYTPIDINGVRWGLLSEIDVAEAFEPIHTFHWIIAIVIALLIITIIAITLPVTRSITTPLGGEPSEMQNISESIASGNLAIHFKNGVETKSVYSSMKKMAANLLKIIGNIMDNSNSLTDAADKTSVLSLQSAKSLELQQSSIEHVATSIEQMTMSINDVAQNSTSAASSAASAQATSHIANTKLSQTISDLVKLDNEISVASKVIKTLELDTHDIGSVLEVIRGIADQTNLLALNAAIEAARAGEQGRGFAVVADEVRALASKTQESTTNIEKMITKLQGASNEAVQAMTNSRDVCEHTLLDAHTTAKMIKDMDSEIDSITNMTGLIASAVKEQSSVSIDISERILLINGAACENLSVADQVSSAGEDIRKIASTLNQLTHQFKIVEN